MAHRRRLEQHARQMEARRRAALSRGAAAYRFEKITGEAVERMARHLGIPVEAMRASLFPAEDGADAEIVVDEQTREGERS